MQEHSKKIQELSNFLLDYATTLMAVGSHTSRIVKNVTRIAESFGFGVDMTIFQRNIPWRSDLLRTNGKMQHWHRQPATGPSSVTYVGC